jgi:hypothetical protein
MSLIDALPSEQKIAVLKKKDKADVKHKLSKEKGKDILKVRNAQHHALTRLLPISLQGRERISSSVYRIQSQACTESFRQAGCHPRQESKHAKVRGCDGLLFLKGVRVESVCFTVS